MTSLKGDDRSYVSKLFIDSLMQHISVYYVNISTKLTFQEDFIWMVY